MFTALQQATFPTFLEPLFATGWMRLLRQAHRHAAQVGPVCSARDLGPSGQLHLHHCWEARQELVPYDLYSGCGCLQMRTNSLSVAMPCPLLLAYLQRLKESFTRCAC